MQRVNQLATDRPFLFDLLAVVCAALLFGIILVPLRLALDGNEGAGLSTLRAGFETAVLCAVLISAPHRAASGQETWPRCLLRAAHGVPLGLLISVGGTILGQGLSPSATTGPTIWALAALTLTALLLAFALGRGSFTRYIAGLSP